MGKNGDLHNPDDPPHINVNEGPQVLRHNNKLFLIYSASACWTNIYSLGMLSTSVGKDLMNSSSWIKTNHPVFNATGHNSFFTSPDGKESWILYHANSKLGQGCGRNRSPRAQKFCWNANDTPDFGEPVAEGAELQIPSGSSVDIAVNNRYNPVLDIDFPHPTIINVNGTYYAYTGKLQR